MSKAVPEITDVVYRNKANRVTTVRIEGHDGFEVAGFVGCRMFPDADHRSDAPLPAWDVVARRLAAEARQQAREGRK